MIMVTEVMKKGEETLSASWKEAEVKILRKQGNILHHEAWTYMSISLTSVICKCFEKIITYRMYVFMEDFDILDR